MRSGVIALAAMAVACAKAPVDPEAAYCSLNARDAGNEYIRATAAEVAAGLGRGINFGNMFDAPNEGAWGTHYRADFAALVKQAGFTHIRLPVRWSNHASATADATLDEPFACRIDGVIDLAIATDLYVVMDMHHYRQLDGDVVDPGEATVEDSVLDQRFVNMWSQLARRYRDRSNRLVYELYNEPHTRLTGDKWNGLAAQALQAVRQSDPDRVVILGATDYDNVSGFSSLQIPADPALMLTVHNYDPFMFTFQGSYIPGSGAWLGTTCCDANAQAQIRTGLDAAAAFAAGHGLPVYLGEFGSSAAADAASRVSYARTVRDLAEGRSMPWAVWSLVDNGIYDPARNLWREDLKTALLGP